MNPEIELIADIEEHESDPRMIRAVLDTLSVDELGQKQAAITRLGTILSERAKEGEERERFVFVMKSLQSDVAKKQIVESAFRGIKASRADA